MEYVQNYRGKGEIEGQQSEGYMWQGRFRAPNKYRMASARNLSRCLTTRSNGRCQDFRRYYLKADDVVDVLRFKNGNAELIIDGQVMYVPKADVSVMNPVEQRASRLSVIDYRDFTASGTDPSQAISADGAVTQMPTDLDTPKLPTWAIVSILVAGLGFLGLLIKSMTQGK